MPKAAVSEPKPDDSRALASAAKAFVEPVLKSEAKNPLPVQKNEVELKELGGGHSSKESACTSTTSTPFMTQRKSGGPSVMGPINSSSEERMPGPL